MTEYIETRIHENERLPCKVPWCPQTRRRIGGYCEAHGRRHQKWSHPEGRRPDTDTRKRHMAHAREFLENNEGHAGIEAAAKWAQGLLDRGARQGTNLTRFTRTRRSVVRQWARLEANGVTGLDVVAATVAALLAVDSGEVIPENLTPSTTFNHRAHVAHVVGYFVVHLVRANLSEKAMPRTRLELGKLLLDELQPLVSKVIASLSIQNSRESARMEAYAEPFDVFGSPGD